MRKTVNTPKHGSTTLRDLHLCTQRSDYKVNTFEAISEMPTFQNEKEGSIFSEARRAKA